VRGATQQNKRSQSRTKRRNFFHTELLIKKEKRPASIVMPAGLQPSMAE